MCWSRSIRTWQPVEALGRQDAVLTRDHRRQPLRWVGHARLRAAGVFAPVVLSAGTLGDSGGFVLSQNQRLLLYPRERLAGVSARGLLVQARELADDDRVHLREFGWTDHYSQVFNAHEIAYAGGVPSKSPWISSAVVNRLPPDLAAELRSRFPGLNQPARFGTGSGRKELETIAPGALIRCQRSEDPHRPWP